MPPELPRQQFQLKNIQQNLVVQLDLFFFHELLCFLTGTAAEVTPVSQIAKYEFEVCDLIKDLNDSYQTIVRKKSAA